MLVLLNLILTACFQDCTLFSSENLVFLQNQTNVDDIYCADTDCVKVESTNNGTITSIIHLTHNSGNNVCYCHEGTECSLLTCEHMTYVVNAEWETIITNTPTNIPLETPTYHTTLSPTINPTINPTMNPTINPTMNPTNTPTNTPTNIPSNIPTNTPTNILKNIETATSNENKDEKNNNATLSVGLIVLGVVIIATIFIIKKTKQKNNNEIFNPEPIFSSTKEHNNEDNNSTMIHEYEIPNNVSDPLYYGEINDEEISYELAGQSVLNEGVYDNASENTPYAYAHSWTTLQSNH